MKEPMKHIIRRCLLFGMFPALAGCTDPTIYKTSSKSFVDAKGLETISINTDDGKAVLSKTDEKDATITMDGTNYSITIKGRGNSSWNCPKKPYTISFPNAITPLGISSNHKKWALLANYLDPSTGLKEDTALYISDHLLEMEWTPQVQFVNLFLNGNYQGLYQLADRAKDGKDCISGYKKKKGGYIAEYDSYYDEEPKFRTVVKKYPVMLCSPDTDDDQSLVAAAEEYIQETEDFLYNQNPTDAQITARLDIPSFATYWIVEALMANADTAIPHSVYMYRKTASDRLHAGPVWDFDYLTCQNPETSSLMESSVYYDCLFKSPSFCSEVKTQWQKLKDNGGLDAIIDHINSTSTLIASSWEQDVLVWGMRIPLTGERFKTFSGETYGITEYFKKRYQVMDSFIGNLEV